MLGQQVSRCADCEKDVWDWFPTVVLYFCNICEGIDMPFVKLAIVLVRPCGRCQIALDDIFDGRKSYEKQLKMIMLAREEYNRVMERVERSNEKEIYRKIGGG